MGVPLLATIQYDPQLVEFDASGRPLAELPADSSTSIAVTEIAQRLFAH